MKKIIIIAIVIITAIIIVVFGLQKFTDLKILSFVKNSYYNFLNQGAKDYRPGQDDQGPPTYYGPSPETHLNIFIRDSKFIPSFNALKIGAEVIWYNQDNKPHTATGDNWDSGQIEPGANFTKKFDTPGKYQYHCSIHPDMKGELIIQ